MNEHALRCDTIAFLMEKRIKVRDALIQRVIEDGARQGLLSELYPDLYREAELLDKRIMVEVDALTR